MERMNCPTCDERISKYASRCPYCGDDPEFLVSRSDPANDLGWGAITMMTLVLLFLIGFIAAPVIGIAQSFIPVFCQNSESFLCKILN
jgi:hypothetical protein